MSDSPAVGAIIDDNVCWRCSIVAWSRSFGMPVEAFENYESFELALGTGRSFHFILADMQIVGSEESGAESLIRIASRFPSCIGKVVMFTVLDAPEIATPLAEMAARASVKYWHKRQSVRSLFNFLKSTIDVPEPLSEQ